MIIELVGLEVFGRHGVNDFEREHGRMYLYDISLEIVEPRFDEVEATVDYRAVAECVREVSDEQSFQLIEALAAAVADELVVRFRPARVHVRVRKPGIAPAGLTVEYSAATAIRES
jgi:7,8-dihydroneopterin aldolase/epimerase/oxygenase